MPFRRRWWAYLGGVSAIRLGLDFFRGDLPTCAGLSPQQLVAVGVLVTLGVIGVRILVSACRGDRDGTGVGVLCLGQDEE